MSRASAVYNFISWEALL